MFQKLISIFKRSFRKKSAQVRLCVADEAIALFANGKETWRFRWETVTKIETYKCDLLTTDMICLDFVIESQQLTYHTHDEMQDFDVLCSQLRRHFPSVAQDWWSQVAFPAFATNHRVLYERTAA
jgi:hypothetical protein